MNVDCISFKHYQKLAEDLGEVINDLIKERDYYLKKATRLEAENWQLKHK